MTVGDVAAPSPIDGQLDALPTVTLEELADRAALLTRYDRKYVVPIRAVPALLDRLPEDLHVLAIDGSRAFRYDTVYFDTPDLRSFLDAAHGRPVRWKVRTRSYLDSGTAWTEVKLRDRRGRTVKHRLARSIDSNGHLGAIDRAFARGLTLDETYVEALSPALRTSYERSTLLEPGSASRMTIDLGLRCALPGGGAVVLDGAAVVETKTAHRASPVDRVLWDAGYRPCRISKYGTGLAAIRHDLPSNRWHRTLTRATFQPVHSA